MISTYLFVDYENVQQFELDTIDAQSTKVFLFVGDHQNRIPFDLVDKAQKFGQSLEWVKIEGQGKNALDFHISFSLGELNHEAPKNISFIIFTKDRGFDPLIKYVNRLGRKCRRINSLLELNQNFQEKIDDAKLGKVIENLSKIDKKRRPRTRNTLHKHMANLLKDRVDESELETLVDSLFITGKVSESNRRLNYNF